MRAASARRSSSAWPSGMPLPRRRRSAIPPSAAGLAIDCGVHEYDLAEWLTGRRVVSVTAWSLPVVDAGVASVGDVDNLVAVLELDDGAVATVDLSRNARYGDDVRTEVLGSSGAVFVDLLPAGRARIGDGDGVRDLPGSDADDAMAAGVAGQARAFAAAVRGVDIDVPGAAASARATIIGQAVIEAARRGTAVEVACMRARVVIHQDDVGMCHGANTAFVELARAGAITSGSVMVPCPWFTEIAEIAAADPALDLGVHLTLTAEKAHYRWRPISGAAAVGRAHRRVRVHVARRRRACAATPTRRPSRWSCGRRSTRRSPRASTSPTSTPTWARRWRRSSATPTSGSASSTGYRSCSPARWPGTGRATTSPA